MKKAFAMPKIVVEQFVPNEYVAACGESGKEYLFECNAGEGTTHTEYFMGYPISVTKYVWDVYTEDGELLTKRGLYGPCGQKHTAPSDSGFIRGYMDNYYTDEVEHVDVIIWTNNGTNVHCTTNLNMSEWETAKS